MIAAIDWVVTHRNDNGMNVRVMNLSFGTDSSQYYAQDPLAHAVENAWNKGIAVVAAAGNSGNGTNGLDNPARDPFVIAVGSVSYAAATGYGKQLQVRGKCVGTLNNNADWAPLALSDCATWNNNQRWNVQSDGTVRHVPSGKCVDVHSAQTGNGTSVILYSCKRWSESEVDQLVREDLATPGRRVEPLPRPAGSQHGERGATADLGLLQRQ